MRRFLVVAVFLLCRCGSWPFVAHGERTLQLVNLIYRHGDRTPVNIYPSDPYQADMWPEGLGQLTPHGMAMHYELGQWLRSCYIDTQAFLNVTYNRDALHVRSTDKDRTLMSAEANLAGLYPPEGKQKWNQSLDWMPVPVHTVPLDQDYLLNMNGPPCPVYTKAKAKTKDTMEYKDLEMEYKEFLSNLTINTGSEIPVDIMNIYKIEDSLFVEKLHNLTWPEWTKVPNFYVTLKKLSDYGMYYLFNTKEKSRLKGGVLVGQVIENMKNKSTTTDPTDLRRKVFVYSAHDTTLAAFQSALGIFNGMQPPLASCIGVELWKEDDGQSTVNIWFRNDTTREPYRLVLDTCNTFSCPLDTFIQVTKDVVPNDIQQECGATSSVLMNNISIIVLVSIVIGLLVVTIVTLIGLMLCRCRQGKTRDGHMRLPTEDMTA